MPRLDALAAAAAEGPEALLDALVAEADAMWAAPHARRADVLVPDERDEARVAAELRAAAGELRALDPALLGGPRSCSRRSAAVEVRQGDATEGVLLADPLEIRARRFRAVFVCGLQDAEFPQRPVPEPFLDDDARRALERASGLRLPLHEDVLDRERSLFYACVSRPQEVLFLSWRSSDEEGEPLVASPFLDDVRSLFTDELWEQRGRRLLAEVTWSPREAPTPRELRRAQAAARKEPDPPPLPAPVSAPVLAQLAARRTEGARQLETFAACGVRWLVEGLLAPRRVTPDPEPMKRGSRAHAVLEATLRRLKDATGSARADAGDAAGRAARRSTPRSTASDASSRAPAARPRGGRSRPTCGATCATRPSTARGSSRRWLEWRFGREGDEHGPLVLRRAARSPGASTASTSGRAARRSCATTRARARRRAPAGRRAARCRSRSTCWRRASCSASSRSAASTSRCGARDSRPRGLVRDDVAGRYVSNDVVDEAGLEAALDEVRERALETAAALQAGRIARLPGALLAQRLRVPDDLPGGRMSR